MRNWRNINYLLNGTERQQAAYRAMRYVGIGRILADFDPLLVGTIPLDIDIESSDLDILLEIPDRFQFAQVLFPHFAHYTNFRYRNITMAESTAWVVNFFAHGFEFELFAQQKPTSEQVAYHHMVIEHRLLEIGGQALRQAIRELKRQGLKTEPAFAHYLGIQNADPYAALLILLELDNEALKILFK
ncbi:MAG: DUF4269 domain-containing protein [Anaerolineae bacterium]|nr:DUF4269 domain-containing protein [Anaerolineae bacterium]MDQ7036943.1 DUF4269 domain-containing protein [Anaerolineae bacterium]